MRALALLCCVACKLDSGTIECGDGITCPAGTTCLAEPVDGVYCVSELCGNGHPYMPIQIRVVNDADYAAWLADAKKKYAAGGSGDVRLAARD